MKNRKQIQLLISTILFSLSVLFFITSCARESQVNCEDGDKGKLVNLTDKLDGCAWVIDLENGSRLEPTNLDDFNLNPIDSQRVSVQYHKVESGVSVCMSGIVVVIEAICVIN